MAELRKLHAAAGHRHGPASGNALEEPLLHGVVVQRALALRRGRSGWPMALLARGRGGEEHVLCPVALGAAALLLSLRVFGFRVSYQTGGKPQADATNTTRLINCLPKHISSIGPPILDVPVSAHCPTPHPHLPSRPRYGNSPPECAPVAPPPSPTIFPEQRPHLVPGLDVAGVGLAVRHLVRLHVHAGGRAVDVLLQRVAAALDDWPRLGTLAPVNVIDNCKASLRAKGGRYVGRGSARSRRKT
eukprot:365681-Chlamydomonas_euryale.AAC.11